ncbi:hypothetical protein OTU49_008989, partial [Cherax quadricarinatus]
IIIISYVLLHFSMVTYICTPYYLFFTSYHFTFILNRNENSLLSGFKSPFSPFSFDVVPIKNKVPEFAHRGDVVRKKADRKQLAGWQCHECEKWYEAHPDPQEKKMMMNKCSRHRSRHNPVINTPENFWDPDWID